MKIVERGPWVFYLGENYKDLDIHKCGKWMYFFDNKDFVANICKEAVENHIVVEAKHSNAEKGVACFYLNGDDLDGHKRVIEFFINRDLIQRTKAGKLYNISFKYDEQTRAGKYGDHFSAEIKLEQFVDLNTGDWLI